MQSTREVGSTDKIVDMHAKGLMKGLHLPESLAKLNDWPVDIK